MIPPAIICLRGGRVIDPASRVDRIADLWIKGDRILGLDEAGQQPDESIDCTGKIVCPGLIDMHVHLREPGREEDETIATGVASAIAGGVTSVACMPNTEPALDSQSAAEFVIQQARRANLANVLPIGAITKGRQGGELSEMGGLVQGGAVAFTDDGTPVTSSEVMRRAMEYARGLGKAILSHSEDLELTKGGVMHEGAVSVRLGLKGMPSAAEEIMVYREIALAEITGAHVHILHVSTAGSVELIRQGKRKGIRVTGEACPHHVTLTDECLASFDANYKMAPPLRTSADIEALIEGLKDGTLEVLATDHAPHAIEKKTREFDQAPNGIIGLETFLPISVKALIEPGHLDWPTMIGMMTIAPARVLGINRGTLTKGAIADVTVIDPHAEWTIDSAKFRSKSRNCPFNGWKVRSRAEVVIVGGDIKQRSSPLA
ncbi:MAG: dihydroorotase [Planctomycetes bacterium]|nr:dihydroorotase [Planctomycetota bacterium]